MASGRALLALPCQSTARRTCCLALVRSQNNNTRLTVAVLCAAAALQRVTYTVVNSQNKKERLTLLDGVSGYLRPGEMSALMGPSGSGKVRAPGLRAPLLADALQVCVCISFFSWSRPGGL